MVKMVKEMIGVNQRASAYVRVRDKNGNKTFRHKKVWEENHGKIPVGYEIHHINGDKKDDRIENLTIMTKKHHAKEHKRIRLIRLNETKKD